MSLSILLAVLAAAFLHALWNALLRFGGSKIRAMVMLSYMEAAVGLAILVTFFRNRGDISVDDVSMMKG